MCVFLAAEAAKAGTWCTLRGDVCVTGEPSDNLAQVAEALSEARTRVRIHWHLTPQTGLRQGAPLQVQINGSSRAASFVTTARDGLSAFDRAVGEILFPRHLRGAALAVEAERAVLLAARASLCPGGNEVLALAEVEPLAALMSARLPEGPTERTPRETVQDARFWSWLDARTAKSPGDFVRGAWAAAASQTPDGDASWKHEPDLLDVARTTLKTPGYGWSELGPALLDFEAAPERLGARGTRDWDLAWEGTTRRVYAPGDLTPYRVSRVAIAKPPARLRVEWEWEQHAHFMVLAVALHNDGSVERRVWVHSPGRGSNVSYTFGGLEQVSELVLLATNTGDADRPYDPDEETPEPHRLSITYADADTL